MHLLEPISWSSASSLSPLCLLWRCLASSCWAGGGERDPGQGVKHCPHSCWHPPSYPSFSCIIHLIRWGARMPHWSSLFQTCYTGSAQLGNCDILARTVVTIATWFVNSSLFSADFATPIHVFVNSWLDWCNVFWMKLSLKKSHTLNIIYSILSTDRCGSPNIHFARYL